MPEEVAFEVSVKILGRYVYQCIVVGDRAHALAIADGGAIGRPRQINEESLVRYRLVSPLMVIEMVCVLTPALKCNVPEAAT